MARKRLWIQKAIKRPGAFTAKAKRAGMSPVAYARHVIATDHKKYGLRTYRQAVLCLTLARLARRKKKGRRG